MFFSQLQSPIGNQFVQTIDRLGQETVELENLVSLATYPTIFFGFPHFGHGRDSFLFRLNAALFDPVQQFFVMADSIYLI
jgi:hypothetical protein